MYACMYNHFQPCWWVVNWHRQSSLLKLALRLLGFFSFWFHIILQKGKTSSPFPFLFSLFSLKPNWMLKMYIGVVREVLRFSWTLMICAQQANALMILEWTILYEISIYVEMIFLVDITWVFLTTCFTVSLLCFKHREVWFLIILPDVLPWQQEWN